MLTMQQVKDSVIKIQSQPELMKAFSHKSPDSEMLWKYDFKLATLEETDSALDKWGALFKK